MPIDICSDISTGILEQQHRAVTKARIGRVAEWTRRIVGLDTVEIGMSRHLVDEHGRVIIADVDERQASTEAYLEHLRVRFLATGLFVPSEDVVTTAGRHLLHDLGVDPDLALGLCELMDSATWTTNGSRAVGAERIDSGTRCFCFLAEATVWMDGQITLVGEALTDTQVSAYGGAPLREMISHPVLDLHDLTIDSIERIEISGSSGSMTSIVRLRR